VSTPPRPVDCAACPFGAFFGTASAMSPEAMDHLLNAAHELIEAARVALDAADQMIEHQRNARAPKSSRLRRINID
jgi:hypothetical protein